MSERTRMVMFAYKWNIPTEDMITICQDRFDEWKKDFDKYVKDEMKSRILTGKARKIDLNDVWGGSIWTKMYV